MFTSGDGLLIVSSGWGGDFKRCDRTQQVKGDRTKINYNSRLSSSK